MSLKTSPWPGLFGGVSQQIAALRHPTQCTEQDNAFATLTRGLFKRPGTKHVATLPLTHEGNSLTGSAGNIAVHDMPDGRQLLIGNGAAMVFTAEGVPEQVAFEGSALAYLAAGNPQKDFRCVSVGDATFVVNRTKVTAMGPVVGAENPVNVAYINVRTAAADVTYKAVVDSNVVQFNSGNAPSNLGIATNLRNQLGAVLTPGMGYTIYIIPHTNIVKVVAPVGTTIDVQVSDGWGNTGLQNLAKGVQRYADLPARFEAGYVVTIMGSAEAPSDPYYVEWDDTKGNWVETHKPTLDVALQASTLPHHLVPNNLSGGWTLKACPWAERLVGDDSTNPKPSFVGRRINHLFFYRNRLGLLSGDSLVMSRAGNYFNFWGASATQVVASDPIDLASPSKDVTTLEWTCEVNKQLQVWGGTKQQFELVTGSVLTPQDARLAETTTFDYEPDVSPVEVGNRTMFIDTVASCARVYLYKVSGDTVTNTADEITQHVPSYISAPVRRVAVSTTVKAALVLPTTGNKVYLYKYDLDEQERQTQKAWQRITFPATHRALHARWEKETIRVLFHVLEPGDPVGGGRYVVATLVFPDLEAPDLSAGISLRLDNRVLGTFVSTTGATSTVTVPYLSAAPLVVLRCVSGMEPVVLTPSAVTADPGNYRTLLTLPGNLNGADLWVGRPFEMVYTPSEPFLLDSNGVPIQEARVKLKRVLFRYEDTGWFTVEVKPKLRQSYHYPMSGRVVGVPGQGATKLGLSSGDFPVPVHADSAGTLIRITSDSYLPVTIPYAEWVGNVTMKASR